MKFSFMTCSNYASLPYGCVENTKKKNSLFKQYTTLETRFKASHKVKSFNLYSFSFFWSLLAFIANPAS